MKPFLSITRICFLLFVLISLTTPTIGAAEVLGDGAKMTAIEAYSQVPLSFEANMGQNDDPQVRFLARGNGYVMLLTPTGVTLTLNQSSSNSEPEVDQPVLSVVQMSLVGANPNLQMTGLGELPGRSNYFVGNDPADWQIDIPNFERVRYRQVWPGIDMMLYGNQRQLEYDFLLAPGAEPGLIKMVYIGADGLEIDPSGNLLLHLPAGVVQQNAPLIYQELNGQRRQVSGGFVLEDKHTVSFRLGEYDPTLPLIIDPFLVYSTYIGGAGDEIPLDITVDDSGNAYIIGQAADANYPTTAGAYDRTFGGGFDAVVSKFNASGGLVYSTYLGNIIYQDTGRWDYGKNIAVDSSGNVYVAGSTSGDFPTTPGCYNANQPYDYLAGFVTKINASGNGLIYSTLINPGTYTTVEGLAVDSSGNAFLTGQTDSSGFPTTAGVYDRTFNGVSDTYVTKLNPTGSGLVWSTYLGGDASDQPRDIALDNSGNPYVIGITDSTNFPRTIGKTSDGVNRVDLFITKLNATASAVLYSSRQGATNDSWEEEGLAIAVDSNGYAYIAAKSDGSNFPTTVGAYDRTYNGNTDGIVAKLDSTGALVYSTWLGSTNYDKLNDIEVDDNGNAYIGGSAQASNFPLTVGAYDISFGGTEEAVLVKLNPAGSGLLYSTFIGGSSGEGIQALRRKNGYIYTTGYASSINFPTTAGVYDTSYNGGSSDGFVAKLDLNTPPTISDIPAQTTNEDAAKGPISFTIGDTETAAASLILSASSSNPTLVPTANITFGGSGANRTVTLTPAANQSGSTTITVTVSDGMTTASDTFTLTVSAINDAPTLSDIPSQVTNEEAATGPISFTIGDVETPAASLTLSGSSSNPTLVPNTNITFGGSGANRTLTVTPLANQNGVATITVTVSDGVATTSDTFSVTVNAVNDAPTISTITDQVTDEDEVKGPLSFTIGDIESQAGSLAVSGSSSNVALVPAENIVLGGSGVTRTMTITPALNQSGITTITLTVNDGTDTAVTSFSLVVNAVNDSPTISNLAGQETNEDTPVGPISFTIDDVETAAGLLEVRGSSANPALVPDSNIVFGGAGATRTVTITPAADQSGTAIITITVDDGTGTISDTFPLTVNAINDVPSISSIVDEEIDEDATSGPILFTIDDIETSPELLEVSATSANAELVPNDNIFLGGTGANRTITLTPALNQSGVTTITILVADGTDAVSSSFGLIVNPINDGPTVSTIAAQETDEDTVTGSISFAVGDFETTAGLLEVSATSADTDLLPNANITLGGSGANRTITLEPAPNQSGTALIFVTVSDGALSTATSFSLTVNSINDVPALSPMADQEIDEDEATELIHFSVDDVESPATDLTVTGNSSNPALVPDANINFGGNGTGRTVTIAPLANQSGVATITITVSDGTVTTSEVFTLTVRAVNDRPTISTIADQVTAEDEIKGPIEFTVSDIETPAGSLTVLGSSSNPDLVPNEAIVLGGSSVTRTVTITPALNQSGVTTLTLTVDDGADRTSTSFSLTVNAVNDTPTISSVADQETDEDTPVDPISFTIGDVETPAGQLELSATSSNTDLVPTDNITWGGTGANRTITITPALNQSGVTTITLKVDDGAATAMTHFRLMVNQVNDRPTLSNIADQEADEDEIVGPISFTIDDVDTSLELLQVSAVSSNADLLPNDQIILNGTGATRTITLQPAANQSGTTIITVAVSDGSLTAATSFSLIVNAVNDRATMSDIAAQETDEDEAIGPINFTVGDVETPAGDLLVSGNSSNPALVPDAHIAFGGSGANRTVTVTPAANMFGTTLITVTADDGAEMISKSFTLTVNPVNDVPTISAIVNQDTAEDETIGPIPFVIDDVETSASALVVSGTSSNPALVPDTNISFAGSGTNRMVTISPAANQSGVTTIIITVTDGTDVVSETFTLTVNAVNDAPTLSPIADQEAAEDTPVGPLSFVVGDIETPAGLLELSATSSNTDLVSNDDLALGGTGVDRTLTITPALNQSGVTTITVVVDDGTDTNSTHFRLTINAVNDVPTISAIPGQEIEEDEVAGPISFTIGDVDSSIDDLSVRGSSSNPTLVPDDNIVLSGSGSNRTVTVTLTANKFGSTAITITVDDGADPISTTFTLTVRAVNDPPTIVSIVDQITDEDVVRGPISFTIGDIETPADSLTLSATSSNPALVPEAHISLGGSGLTRTVVITPELNQNGVTTIALTVDDGTDLASTNFTLTVNAVNDAPTISAIPAQITPEDMAVGPIYFSIGDIETSAALLLVSATSSNPTLVPDGNIILGGGGANRTVMITPETNQSGITAITMTVDDGSAMVTETFILTVIAVNDPPVISNIADQVTDEDTTLGPLSFSVSDVETLAGDLIVSATSSNETLVPNDNIGLGSSGANRTLTLTPALNRSGVTTITIVVADGTDTTMTNFSLTVNPINDRPTLSHIADQETEEDTAVGPIGFTIGDVETSAGLLEVSTTSSNPELAPEANIVLAGSGVNRTISITPTANLFGVITITMTVTDGTDVISDSFTLTVKAVNDAPTLSTLPDQVTDEDTSIGPLNFTIDDVETPAPLLSVSGSSSNPDLVADDNIVVGGSGMTRTVTITPTANQNGIATITLTVEDGADTISSTFTLTIKAVNDVPTVSTIANQVTDEDATNEPISFTIGDVETAADDLIVTGRSSNAALVADHNILFSGSGVNRTVSVTPAANEFGLTTIMVLVDDGVDTTATTFTLTINPVNDMPTISPVANQVTDEDEATGPISFTIDDIETPAVSLAVSGSSSNTALVPNSNILLGGDGPDRTVRITPVANRTGATIITVMVDDGSAVVSETFSLTVNPINDPPTISGMAAQATNEDTPIGPISFTIDDVEMSAALLEVTASSAQAQLVPNANIALGGSGADRTLTVIPAANQSGVVALTVMVSDGLLTGTTSFSLTVNAVNDPPAILAIADQETNEDETLGPISFTIDDLETSSDDLIVSGRSTDPDLVPHSSLSLSGSGTTRTLTITPVLNQSGSTTITLTVNDGTETTARSFKLIVNAVNDAPTLSPIPDQVTAYQTTRPISFTIADVETPAALLEVRGSSSNPSLVPDPNIVFAGNGLSRTVTITPASNQSGVAIVTISVDDGMETVSGTFTLTVNSAVDDSDGDGMRDGWEVANGLDAMADDAAADPDDDGLNNLQEYQAQTDPQGFDSDNDGIADSADGLNDNDEDGMINALDADDDEDGVPTKIECPNGLPCPDSDGDGLANYLDADPDMDDDGLSNALEDADGDGNPANDDADNDGLANYLDADSDNDGLLDAAEGTGDSDGDGLPNYLDSAVPLMVRTINPVAAGGRVTTTLTLSGEGFLPTPQVKLDDLNLADVTYVSTKTIRAVLPAGLLSPGVYDVTVINPDGQGSATLPRAFTLNQDVSSIYLPLIFK